MSFCNHVATCGEDVKFWDFPNLIVQKQLNITTTSRTIANVSWSQDGRQLASLPYGDDKVVLTYVKNNIFSTVDLAVDTKVTNVKFLKKSLRYLSLGCSDGKVLIWDLKSQKLKQSYSSSAQSTAVVCLEPNWNDTLIAAGYGNGDIVLYNLIMGRPLSALKTKNNQAIRNVCFNSVKNSLLGSSCDSGTVALWDTNTKKLLHQFSSHFAPSTGLSFSPFNDILLTSVGLDKKVICYDIHSKSPVQTLNLDSPLTCVEFMSNGVMLAVGTSRGQVVLYDLRHSSTPYKSITAHKTSVSCISSQNIPNENQSKSNDVVKSKEKVVKKPEYNISKNVPPDQVDNISASSSPTMMSESRNSLTNKIFSPICEGELCSVSESPVFSNGRSSVGDGLNVSTEIDKKISDFPSSQVRRQPIGSGLQTPPLIGDRPITAGFAENDSKVSAIPDRVRRRSNSLENRNSGSGSYNGSITKTPSNVPDVVHFIQSAKLSSNSSLKVFSPIDFPHTSSFDQGEATSQSISSQCSSARNSSSPVSTSESRNVDGDERSNDQFTSISPDLASADKSVSTEAVQSCTNCREHNQQVSHLNTLKIDAIQKQIQELRDDLEDLHDMTHRDYLNLHVAIVKEFQIQLNEVRNCLKYFSINEDLLKQIEELQEENRHLRAMY